MKNYCLLLFTILVLFVSCGEYSAITKHGDYEYKYEAAKAYYALGKYQHTSDLLNSVVVTMKGTTDGEHCLFLMGMSCFMHKDYEVASDAFRKYYQSYPKGIYVEEARYYSALALYENVPDPRLDQTSTQQAITELQSFLDYYPSTRLKEQTQEMIQRLQDHMVEKELLSAQLYYNLGSYIGNCMSGGSNYEACIVTAENALRDFPYASDKRREQFMMLILRSRFHLAKQSVEEKRLERFRQTIDEYYGFANEFPESDFLKEAQDYLTKSQKAIKGQPIEDI